MPAAKIQGQPSRRHGPARSRQNQSVREEERQLPSVPPRDGDADVGERRRPGRNSDPLAFNLRALPRLAPFPSGSQIFRNASSGSAVTVLQRFPTSPLDTGSRTKGRRTVYIRSIVRKSDRFTVLLPLGARTAEGLNKYVEEARSKLVVEPDEREVFLCVLAASLGAAQRLHSPPS